MMARSKSGIAAGAAALLLVCGVVGAAVLPRVAPAREIRLVARDMTYYVEGQSAPNPGLRIARGEKVRIVLRNEDPGMTHDFTVSAWNLRMPPVAAGEEARLAFSAPSEAGAAAYACSPHGQTMRGTMTVE